MLDNERPSLERQLFSNQLWETVAFVAKAVFMVGLAPWMIRIWGAQGYGEFALASSTFVLLSVCDFGIRGRTRVALSTGLARETSNAQRVLAESLLAFGSICLVVLSLTVAVTIFHGWSWLLGVRGDHENLLLVTTALTLPYMFCTIMLEPIIVRGGIGSVKSAAAAGWILATPLVALVLGRGGSVVAAIATWLSALLLANLCLLAAHLRELHPLLEDLRSVSRSQFVSVFRESLWFSVTSLTWAAKSHGLTLLIGALSGPAIAGVFFIILRLSEMVSALGAISFDVALATLPRCRSAAERQQCFKSTCRYTLFFTLPCAAGIAILAPVFFRFWLRTPAPLGWQTGMWIAGLGLAITSNRFVTYVALGLEAGRTVAFCGAAEIVITVAGVSFLQPMVGLIGSLSVTIAAVVVYLPAVWLVREKLTTEDSEEWRTVDLLPLAPCPSPNLAARPDGFPV